MIAVAPGQAFKATTDSGVFDTGLVGTIGVALYTDSGATTTARSTANIIELVAGSAVYSATALTAPPTTGQYTLYWDDGAGTNDTEDLVVTSSAFVAGTPNASDLSTLASVKSWLGITDSTQDARLQQLLTAASKAVPEYAQREFAPVSVAQTRTFALKRDGLITFGNGDLQSVTQVQIDTEPGGSPTTLTQDQYELWPVDAPHGVYRGIKFYTFTVGPVLRQWFGLHRYVSVTGTWGFPSIPADVEQATIITVAKWFKRDEVAWSNEIPTPSLSDGQNLPYDARMLVQPYKRVI